MSVERDRMNAIGDLIAEAKAQLFEGVTDKALQGVKAALMRLTEQRHLFTQDDYPLPAEDKIDRNYLIHEEDDGSFALYVNSSRPGQRSRPHNHGGTWAVVAAVSGQETHRLYCDGADGIRLTAEMTVEPGTAVALGPDGIHEIHAESTQPLLHLHLYGLAFRMQGERKEYDLDTGAVHAFVLDDFGFIEDAR